MNSVVNNEEEQRFEINADGELAVLEYKLQGGILILIHTEVPENLQGRGIGSTLARNAFEWATENNKKVKVYCSFVKTFLDRHPEYNAIVVH